MKTLLIMTLLSIFTSTYAVEHSKEKFNYMICEVELTNLKGKTLSKTLVSTYNPSSGVMNIGSEIYHYPETAVSACSSKAFDKKYNKKNFEYNWWSKKITDICFRITNGVHEDNDGYAEIYIAKRSVSLKNFSLDYLNRNTPIILNGTMDSEDRIGDYIVKSSCQNKMLSVTDPLWSQIRTDKLD